MKNKYIVRENSSGKTRELLEFAKENNLIVICRDAIAMERKAQAYGIYGLNFFSYEEIVYLYDERLELASRDIVTREITASTTTIHTNAYFVSTTLFFICFILLHP